MGAEAPRLRIMLGFVVRQCAVALGHAPSADELAEWANNQRDARGHYRIFGRAITTVGSAGHAPASGTHGHGPRRAPLGMAAQAGR